MGITTEELSAKSGVPIGTLNKILAGQTTDPKFETLKALCKALGIKLSDLEDYEPNTLAAHHDEEDWTAEELAEIEKFKDYIKSKRTNNSASIAERISTRK